MNNSSNGMRLLCSLFAESSVKAMCHLVLLSNIRTALTRTQSYYQKTLVCKGLDRWVKHQYETSMLPRSLSGYRDTYKLHKTRSFMLTVRIEHVTIWDTNLFLTNYASIRWLKYRLVYEWGWIFVKEILMGFPNELSYSITWLAINVEVFMHILVEKIAFLNCYYL